MSLIDHKQIGNFPQGSLKGQILTGLQGLTTGIAEAGLVYLTAQPTADDQFNLKNGAATETYKFVALEAAPFEVTIGASLLDTMTNLGQAIADDSAIANVAISANFVTTRGVVDGAGSVLLIAASDITSTDMRMYIDKLSGGAPAKLDGKYIDYTGELDYSKTTTSSLPTSDPAAGEFGPRTPIAEVPDFAAYVVRQATTDTNHIQYFFWNSETTSWNTIHDNDSLHADKPGEIVALPLVTVANEDKLLIEDFSDNNEKKAILASDLLGGGGANELNDLTDVTTGLPGLPTVTDFGRVLYFDNVANDWVSDNIANISNVVKEVKTSVGTGTIAKGTPVYLDGFDSDLLVVEPADAASAATMPCIGIAAETIDSTGPNRVVSFGKIQGVDTSSFAQGVFLWVASGGGLTDTRPTGTAETQQVAVVLKGGDAVGGSIKVFNTSRAANLPNLTNGKIWQGDVDGYPQEVDPATAAKDWIPPTTDVSSGTAGQSAALVSIPIGTGAGHYRNYAGSANDTWATIVPLYNNGVAYDGRNITIDLHWMPFGAVGAGDDVEWTVEYYFGRDGIDVFSQATTSVVTLIDITGRTSQLQYTDTVGTISGLTGDTQLHLIIRRNSQGATPDTYSGDVELYSITFR